jgi:hypothetical protein
MSIHISPPTLADRILRVMGKRRGIVIPTEIHKKFGPYVHSTAVRESFWKALLRPKDAPLPKGVIDWEEFIKEFRNEKG